MKKMLLSVLAVMCVLCVPFSLAGCANSDSVYCDPRGKAWYNVAELPQINDPFSEVYDGIYSITVEKNGRVCLMTADGEVLEGTLTPSYNGYNIYSARIFVQFDNGNTASGWCNTDSNGRTLTLEYDFKQYCFSDIRALSEQEFVEYRARFVDFLLGVYETGEFPSEEEIAANDLYRQFTYYVQIDPCCDGPFVYDTVERATIQSIERIENADYMRVLTLDVDGERAEIEIYDDAKIVNVKSGEMLRLDINDLRKGECLVFRDASYAIESIFYFERN